MPFLQVSHWTRFIYTYPWTYSHADTEICILYKNINALLRTSWTHAHTHEYKMQTHTHVSHLHDTHIKLHNAHTYRIPTHGRFTEINRQSWNENALMCYRIMHSIASKSILEWSFKTLNAALFISNVWFWYSLSQLRQPRRYHKQFIIWIYHVPYLAKEKLLKESHGIGDTAIYGNASQCCQLGAIAIKLMGKRWTCNKSLGVSVEDCSKNLHFFVPFWCSKNGKLERNM